MSGATASLPDAMQLVSTGLMSTDISSIGAAPTAGLWTGGLSTAGLSTTGLSTAGLSTAGLSTGGWSSGVSIELIELLWQTSWQAGLMAVVVWLACRRWPRLPATVRTSLWWLVCLKFVVGLAWPQPIALAVLPQPSKPDVTAASTAGAASTPVSGAHDASIAAPWRDPANGSSANSGSANASSANSSSANPSLRTANSSSANAGWRNARAWAIAVAILWLLGVVVQGVLLARQLVRTRTLIARARPVDAETATLFEDLCARVGLSTAPRLLASTEIDTPLVTGVRQPTVLVPAAMLSPALSVPAAPTAAHTPHASHASAALTASAAPTAARAARGEDAAPWSRPELAMTLCHELLHIRRRDLWHGWIPSAAAHLFFFHPLAALAAREYALAREAACDARVLHLLRAPAADYGRLIVRLGVRPRDAAPAAAGASASFRTLKRRLIMLHDASLHARALSPRWWIVGALAAAAVLPVRLVAQPESPSPRSSERATIAVSGLPSPTSGTSAASASATSAAGTYTVSARTGRDGTMTATVETPDGRELPARVTVTRNDEAAQSARSGAEKPAAQRSSRDGWGEPWVLLTGGGDHSMSGDWSHVREARRLQSSASERLLWFLRDGRPYVLRDADTLDAIEALWAPQRELGALQGELGDRQGKLGAQQGNLGARQGDLGAQQAALGARLNDANADILAAVAAEMRSGDTARARTQRRDAEARLRDLSNKMSELGEQQAALGREQAALGEKQAELGREQSVLGERQAELARKAVQEMRGVIEKALTSGLAVPVP